MVHEFEMKVKDTPVRVRSPYSLRINDGSAIHYHLSHEDHFIVDSITVLPVDDTVHLEFINERGHILFDVTMNKEDAFEFSTALKEVLAQYGLKKE
jgi:hypothetical protein